MSLQLIEELEVHYVTALQFGVRPNCLSVPKIEAQDVEKSTKINTTGQIMGSGTLLNKAPDRGKSAAKDGLSIALANSYNTLQQVNKFRSIT
jgi:hypothetical protein